MSNLPVGWLDVPFGSVVQIQKGKKPQDLGPRSDVRTVAYINIAAFETKKISEYAPSQDLPVCEPEDTLLVWDGARAGLAGRGSNGFVGSTLTRLRSEAIVPGYLYYFVKSQYDTLNGRTKGVGIPHIDPVILFGLKFPLAPYAEQTRIVKKLESLLSNLDAAEAELKAAEKKLAQYRQSLLKAAVNGSLTADWRVKNIPTESGAQLLSRILHERRARWEAKQLAMFKEKSKALPKDWKKKYPEPVQPPISGAPSLPLGWVWVTIDQIAKVGTGITPLRSETKYFSNGKIPWTTSGTLNKETVSSASQFVTELALKELRLEIFPPGSLLIAMYGEGKTRGKCAELLIPSAVNQAIAAIVLEPNALPIKAYLKLFLLECYERLRSLASGGVQPNLNLQIVKSIALPIPPQAEQIEITNILKEKIEQIEIQQTAIALALTQSTAQRQNILRAAFFGQLVPQDNKEEPASALLSRIQADYEKQKETPRNRKIYRHKETKAMNKKMIDVLGEAEDWISAQDAFQLCGIADGAGTEQVEALYAQLRELDQANRLAVQIVTNKQGRKMFDRLKLVEG